LAEVIKVKMEEEEEEEEEEEKKRTRKKRKRKRKKIFFKSDDKQVIFRSASPITLSSGSDSTVGGT
jgi:hypothetical protein